jgi:hypothetical protein
MNGCGPPCPALGTISILIVFPKQLRIKPLLLEPMGLAIEANETYLLWNSETDLRVTLRPVGAT